jgi:glutamate racemase
MTERERPIGIFDSGLGGLTVQKEILKLLPNESTIYFGDNGRSPYGSKSKETIIRFSRQIVRFLQEQKVKMIVIACNTASAFAFDTVADLAGMPVIEVISPGAAAAIAASHSKRIGVIGTRGTIDSGVYEKALQLAVDHEPLTVISKACPLFVGLAEEGWWDHPVTRMVAQEYLDSLKAAGIDTLVMGCTHYPLLERTIAAEMGHDVTLIGSGKAVAETVKSQLDRSGLANKTSGQAVHRYFTSDSPDHFTRLGSAFLQQQIDQATHVNIEQYTEN